MVNMGSVVENIWKRRPYILKDCGSNLKFLIMNFWKKMMIWYVLNTYRVNLSVIDLNPLPDDKILDWSKLEEIANDILKCIKNEK